MDQIQFAGLRRISPAAIAAHIATHSGSRMDPGTIAQDVRALIRLGWFDSIQVEQISSSSHCARVSETQKQMTLIFHLEERPFLTKIEYSGSRLLSTGQIEKFLEEQKISPVLGQPIDPVALYRVASAIRSSLHQLGHPEAAVHIQIAAAPNATVSVRFLIDDGPHLPVRRIQFEGDPALSGKLLRAQMQNIGPDKLFASLRGKNAYSNEAFEEDRQRILTYYEDHGYPEARVGNARIAKFSEQSWRRFPWLHRSTQSGLLLSIPVEAGPFYRLASIETSDALERAVAKQGGKSVFLPATAENRAFSRQQVDKLRSFYSARLQPSNSQSGSVLPHSVVANPIFDTEHHSVHLKLALSDSPPYVVHRIEFQGLHKFNDRYVRRRIPLREGRPIDERTLESGLTRLARTGYFKAIHKEDVHVKFNEARHTADIEIHLEEIGQQRATFSGGRSQFGNTLGLAYTVFDLLNHEELLFAKFEAGPETLQIAMGIAKEGVFGTRGSLAFSIFDNVLRPRLAHSVQGPFFNSHSEGISVPYTYALSGADSLGITYTLSRTTSDDPLGTPPVTAGLPPIDLRTRTSSRSLGTAWAHDTGNERMLFSGSASGSFLGGDENMVRSSGEAARIFRDPLFSPSNAWAFRTIFSGAGSYRGNMPLYSRFFSGDEFVRGLRPGELGPFALTGVTLPSGNTASSPSLTGANLITAANAEYRIPLHGGTEVASFFDLGSGWLLPNWLGPTKPVLLSATNGALHGSTGVEFRWTVPGIQVPLRSYYAFDALRLDRRIPLSGKSFLFAHNRFSAFGWGLGPLF